MANVKPLFFNASEAVTQEAGSADVLAVGQLLIGGIGGVGINMQGQGIQNLPAPVNASDPATKGYADALAQGLQTKVACVAVATSPITLSGAQTIDGVSVVAGNRVLVIAQADARANGLYLCQAGAWARPADFAAGASADGNYVFTEQGTSNSGAGFVCLSPAGSAVIGTNALTWTQFTGAGEINAGSGITKSGNTLSVNLAPTSGLQFSSGALDHFLNATGGLAKDASGLRLSIINAGAASATLQSTANGVSVLGLPSLFTVNGTATSANVTAANLGTLTAGSTSIADAIHTHQSTLSSLATVGYHVCASTLAAGDPVYWSSTSNTLARADASSSASARVVGIAGAAGAQGTTVPIYKRGIAAAVFPNATPGAPVFLNTGGGLTATAPTGSNISIVRMGYVASSTGDVDVMPFYLGQRSA